VLLIISCPWLLCLGISIPQKIALAAMAVVSAVVLLYLLSNIFWWTLFSSGFMVGMHALLRDASMHKDEDDKVVMSGDLTLDAVDQEQASFLNSGDAV
jgi:CBS domain containing-hemolysin-like protein